MCQKDNAIDTEIPKTTRLVTKTQYYSDKQGLEKNIEDLDKGNLILLGWSKILATTQKLQRMKKR